MMSGANECHAFRQYAVLQTVWGRLSTGTTLGEAASLSLVDPGHN